MGYKYREEAYDVEGGISMSRDKGGGRGGGAWDCREE